MINAVNPISNILKINMSASLYNYKVLTDSSVMAVSAVYESFCILSGAKDGITLENLNSIQKLLQENDLADSSAFKLASTLTERFSNLSSDGKKITKEDLTTAVKFSVTQDFLSDLKLERYMINGKFNISQDLISQYGFETAQTMVVMKFLDSLSDETVGKIVNKMSNAKARNEADHRNYSSPKTQEIPQKITLPVDIRV